MESPTDVLVFVQFRANRLDKSAVSVRPCSKARLARPGAEGPQLLHVLHEV